MSRPLAATQVTFVDIAVFVVECEKMSQKLLLQDTSTDVEHVQSRASLMPGRAPAAVLQGARPTHPSISRSQSTTRRGRVLRDFFDDKTVVPYENTVVLVRCCNSGSDTRVVASCRVCRMCWFVSVRGSADHAGRLRACVLWLCGWVSQMLLVHTILLSLTLTELGSFLLPYVAYLSIVYIVEIALRVHCEGWADFWCVSWLTSRLLTCCGVCGVAVVWCLHVLSMHVRRFSFHAAALLTQHVGCCRGAGCSCVWRRSITRWAPNRMVPPLFALISAL